MRRVTYFLTIVCRFSQEIDDLVDEWVPEPLAQPLSPREQADLAAVPVIAGPTGPKPKLLNGKTVFNLASYNFTGLSGNAEIKESSVETLRKYGLGSCGPPGFYGTQGTPVASPPARTLLTSHVQTFTFSLSRILQTSWVLKDPLSTLKHSLP